MHRLDSTRALALLLAGALAPAASAQDFGITLDLNPTPLGSISAIHHGHWYGFTPIDMPQPFVAAGGQHVFTGRNKQLGAAAYLTTGLPGGAKLIADPNPGGLDLEEEVMHFTPFQNGVAFMATDGSTRTLYHFDFATQATVEVAEIGLDDGAAGERGMVVVNGKLLFGVTTFGGGGLWCSDGTAAGTGPVVEFGTGMLWELEAAPNGQVAYFYKESAGLPTGLYSTDGTAAGTQLLLGNTVTGASDGSEDWIAFLGNDAIVGARVPGLGHQLYRTDGTVAGTQFLKDFTMLGDLPPDLDHAVEWNGKLYFNAWVSNGKRKLYETDGTPAGTRPVLQGTQIPTEPRDMQVFAGALHFTAEAPGAGRELYRYDGIAQTRITGAVLFGHNGAGDELTAAGGKLFWVESAGATTTLVASDGTGLGTSEVAGAPFGTAKHPVQNLTATSNGELLFGAPSPAGHAGLWRLDPATLSATLVFELDGTSGTAGSFPSTALRVGKEAYVAATGPLGRSIVRVRPDLGTELAVDGSALDVQLDPTLHELPARALLFFTAEAAGLGAEPYALVDGTATLLGDLSPGVGSTTVFAQAELGGHLFFVAQTTSATGVAGTDLWRTDGTPVGTSAIHAAAPSDVLVAFGGQLLFMGTDALHGTEPWISDGTPSGAQLLADLTPGTASSDVEWARVANGLAYFVVRTGGVLGELYATDGTGALALGADDVLVLNTPAVWEGALYFVDADATTGAEVWTSTGTPATTHVLADLVPGPGSSAPTQLTATAAGLFFATTGGTGLQELVRSDGTAAGTVQVSDFDGQFSGGIVNGVFDTVDGVRVTANVGDGTGRVLAFDGSGLVTILSSSYGWFFSDSIWMAPLGGGLLIAGSNLNPLGPEPVFGALGEARVEPLETGGSGNVIGALSATAAQLGGVVKVTSTGLPGGGLAALASAPVVAWPAPVAGLGAGYLWLDPSALTVMGLFAGANWVQPALVPTTPALFGKSVVVQALYYDALGTPAELSNGLLLTIGL